MSIRVLIIEDDESTHTALRYLFRQRGAEVTIATTLAEARDALRTGMPDAIVLDLMLPDGNGVDILRDLRAAGSDVKVVVTTGMADPERMQSLVSLHPHAILRKPIDFAGLLRTIL